ncbi:uncharacterized protein LOC132710852 [Pantherophis guttatus]|uniref:Uncharacterized protein LOC132710852 n=1 Tax=Pantherophis guttatus TaxID=94885 RepID=A0ABM3Z768_PANGU|nr:uncharacterized protein LOC132710852 [Pantherophis guttatus]
MKANKMELNPNETDLVDGYVGIRGHIHESEMCASPTCAEYQDITTSQGLPSVRRRRRWLRRPSAWSEAGKDWEDEPLLRSAPAWQAGRTCGCARAAYSPERASEQTRGRNARTRPRRGGGGAPKRPRAAAPAAASQPVPRHKLAQRRIRLPEQPLALLWMYQFGGPSTSLSTPRGIYASCKVRIPPGSPKSPIPPVSEVQVSKDSFTFPSDNFLSLGVSTTFQLPEGVIAALSSYALRSSAKGSPSLFTPSQK